LLYLFSLFYCCIFFPCFIAVSFFFGLLLVSFSGLRHLSNPLHPIMAVQVMLWTHLYHLLLFFFPLILACSYINSGASIPSKSMMHIVYSPCYHKIYNFPPISTKFINFLPIFIQFTYFWLNLRILALLCFDHLCIMLYT